MATKDKNKLKRVKMEESLYMRFLYVEKGVLVSELIKHFPDYSRATIVTHVKRPVKDRSRNENSIKGDQKNFH